VQVNQLIKTIKQNLEPKRKIYMKTITQSRNGSHKSSQDPMDHLSDAASDLVVATEEVAEEKITQAREQVMVALEKSREAYEIGKKKALEGAKVADKYVHANPYKAAGIAFGVGALLALFFKRS
jgi:ElaB/YqjD/DUF883 family membrane-anchored ribosome-binding protein